jgi:hypothetical protein
MNPLLKRIGVVIAGLALSAGAALAVPVTVEELGLGANQVVSISSSTLGTAQVYAGVVKLKVDGVATDAFCIDPWHWSIGGAQPYDLVPLTSAPKPPGPMSAAAALQIEQLWKQFYSPTITDNTAAALQIAIWQTVDAGVSGGTFSLVSTNDYGASSMLSWVTSNPTAPAANLVALTGRGQDYVIPSVPDVASSAALLGLSLAGLMALRKRAKLA